LSPFAKEDKNLAYSGVDFAVPLAIPRALDAINFYSPMSAERSGLN
jgi:hypothetical protein